MKPNKHIMKKTNLKYEAKHEIPTHTQSKNALKKNISGVKKQKKTAWLEKRLTNLTARKWVFLSVIWEFLVKGRGSALFSPLDSSRERIGKQKRARESSEGARFWVRLLIPVPTRITPTGVEAIIKTSNEFYVCACPPPFHKTRLFRSSPGFPPVVAWNRFSFLWIGRFPRVEISAIDRRHPRRAQFGANLVAKRKKNLTNSISSHQKNV